jgi:serine/threonine protein kinase
MSLPSRTAGRFTGPTVELPQAGQICLGPVLANRSETALYDTDCPGIVVKLFNLECSKPDEISYGPYLGFKLELANYEEIQKNSQLAGLVPTYHGAHIDYERKYACIAMEYLEGQDLKSWCEQEVEKGQEEEWLRDFRRAIYETLGIIHVFHSYGIILLDLKPENILRLRDGHIRLVDLGAFFTPRHAHDLANYVYSATPEHAEVLIDASNLQSGLPPTEASDVFSAGVALFEMATGTSRLLINDSTAQEILEAPELYRFLDSQIRDIWHGFPHLRALLPLVQTQLVDRHLLFSEVWNLLKAYIGRKVPDWESLPPPQQDQILVATGTTFIMEQLPPPLLWLAGPIAQATTLRSARLKTIAELMTLLAEPVTAEVLDSLSQQNAYLQYLAKMDMPLESANLLNTWEVRLHAASGTWAIAAQAACYPVSDSADFLFLKQCHREPNGHRYFQVVDELEADELENSRLTLRHLANDRQAWLL